MATRPRGRWGKLKLAAVMGGLVGAAVFLEAKRQLRPVPTLGVGLLVSNRWLPAGHPVVLADYGVRWVPQNTETADFYSDQQWGELAAAKLVCDLNEGEPLARVCVVSGKNKAARPAKEKKKRGIVLWTEIDS